MPFYPPFNMPFFYNNYRYPNKPFNQNRHIQEKKNSNEFKNLITNSYKKASENTKNSESCNLPRAYRK